MRGANDHNILPFSIVDSLHSFFEAMLLEKEIGCDYSVSSFLHERKPVGVKSARNL